MWMFILAVLLGSPEKCSSTEFGYQGDYLAGGKALHLGRPVDPQHDVGIAHRTLPLGSMVVLHIPSRDTWTTAVVIDRGPYGRLDSDGSWYNGASDWKRCGRKRGCYPPDTAWRGCADLTPKTAELLEHDGWEQIHIYPVKGSYVSRGELLNSWGGNS